MRESIFETLIGLVVVSVAGVFLWFALASGGDNTAGNDKYELTARFNNVSGVARGSDVRLAGVKVGVVQAIEADYERAEGVLTLTVDQALELADDTSARISTDGLLGGAYVSLEQGGGFDVIPRDGTGEIVYTRGSVDLLTLFASFASGSGGDGEDEQ
ncbi:MAG: MlaD family protein [Pseudomonadota bacterium]